jgi:hypothetical protein
MTGSCNATRAECTFRGCWRTLDCKVITGNAFKSGIFRLGLMLRNKMRWSLTLKHWSTHPPPGNYVWYRLGPHLKIHGQLVLWISSLFVFLRRLNCFEQIRTTILTSRFNIDSKTSGIYMICVSIIYKYIIWQSPFKADVDVAWCLVSEVGVT